MTRTHRQDHPSIIRAVQSFWARYYPDGYPLVWKQSGGEIISDDEYQYSYRESLEGTTILLSGSCGEGKRPCFLLFLEPDNMATLQDVTRDYSIYKEATPIHAAVALAKREGATRLTLVDNCVKNLPSGKSFRLADMYFMTTGKTWYETMIPGLQPETKQDKIPIWREKVHTASWDTIESALREQVPDISIPVPVHDIDTSVPGTAMLVLSAQTEFFAYYEDELINAFKIGSLFAITWTVSLTPPSAGPALRNPL